MLGLALLDWLVLGVYIAGITWLGLWVSRSVATTGDYFMGGRRFGRLFMVAQAFGTLLEALWTAEPGAVAPTVFKRIMGRIAPMFAGNEQHDAQELLTFLLDALHEDLNRCASKPYVEAVEC
ncbi:MAG: hypothetical protein AAFX41_15765, partial [Bacteroidota bacterium]